MFSLRFPLALGLLAVAACTEPVDCQRQPERCVIALAATPAATRKVQAEPMPAAAADPHAGHDRAAGDRAGHDHGQRLGVPSPGAFPALADAVLPPGGRLRRGMQPFRPGQGDVPAADRGDETPALRAAVAAIRTAAAAHDGPALQAFLTPRLQESLAPVLARGGDRLWRHLDKYVAAIQAGLTIQVAPGESPDTRQLTIPAEGGSELKPILKQTESGWKFERF